MSREFRLLPIGVWALAMAWVFWPQLASGLGSMPALLSDPRLVNYTLEHGTRWLIGQPPHTGFWDVPLFHPQPGVAAYTDVMIGAGLPYWIARLLSAAPDTAFQLWMLACASSNFAAGYVLARRGLGATRAASSFGAWLLAFGGPQVVHIWHPQLLPMFYVYVAALAAFEVFGERNRTSPRARRLWIAAAGAAIALQAYTAFYPLFFFGLFGALALAVACARRAARARLVEVLRADLAYAVGTVALTIAAIAPLAVRYLATAQELGMRPYMARFVPRPASWVLLGPDNYVWGWLVREGGPLAGLSAMEHGAGVGLATAVVGLVGLVRARRRRGLWIPAAALALLFVLSTSFGDASLWRAVHAAIPGAAAIRVPSRIAMVAALVTAFGVVCWLDDLWRRGRIAWACGLALLCALEQLRAPFPQIAKAELRAHVESIAARVPPDCAAFLAVYNGPPGYPREDDDAAWVQLATRIPTVNGRYGNHPRHWKLYRHQSDGARPDRALLRVELERWLSRFGVDPGVVCWVEYPHAPSGASRLRPRTAPARGRAARLESPDGRSRTTPVHAP